MVAEMSNVVAVALAVRVPRAVLFVV